VQLILGHYTDPVIQHFARFLRHTNKDASSLLLLDPNRFGSDIWADGQQWWLGQQRLKHTAVTAVWNRLVEPAPNQRSARKLIPLIDHLLNTSYARIYNRPLSCCDNQAKLYHICHHISPPLQLPESYIFANTQLKPTFSDWVNKAPSGQVEQVRLASDSSLTLTSPRLIQEYIAGENIRVHVIDQWTHAISIYSDTVDYRYGSNTKFSTRSLPVAITQACLAITASSGLRFAGIDLIYRPPHYYLLEINPAPGYSYFEQQLSSYPISEQLYASLSTKHSS